MKRLFSSLLFLLIFLPYWNTGRQIENRAEAEDAFEYALMVEQGESHAWYFHAHHLIFGPVMRSGYKGARLLGYPGRAIDVMRSLSALAATGTLFFFFLFCYNRVGLRSVASLVATAFLAVTYGFWRYSAEAEIPLVASFFMVAALFHATDPTARPRSFGLVIGLSCLAVCMHIMNAVAVFAAIPCFYLLQRRWKAAGFHVMISAAVILGLYRVVELNAGLYGGGGADVSALGLNSFVKGLIALVQCVISCDFMLGYGPVRALLGELFPGRMLLEEFYLGERLPGYHVLLSTLTFLVFNLLCVACVLRAGWVWKTIAADRKQLTTPAGWTVPAAVATFFVVYASLILLIEPGNPELWVMGLVPLALLFCGIILYPLTVDNRLWLPLLMVFVLLLHNGCALRVLYDPSKDYQHQKAAKVLQFAGVEDVVVTAGNPVFERYLRYHFDGQVWYLHHLEAYQVLAAELPQTNGELYALGDVFQQPRSLRIRFPERSQRIDQFAELIRSQSERISEDEFGGVYRLMPVIEDQRPANDRPKIVETTGALL